MKIIRKWIETGNYNSTECLRAEDIPFDSTSSIRDNIGFTRVNAADLTPGFIEEKIQDSIQVDPVTNKIGLENDENSPQSFNYYGTDENGDRGFYPLGLVKINENDSPGYLNSKVSGSIITDSTNFLLLLDGDKNNPDVLSYYGTDVNGIKGFYSVNISETNKVKTDINDPDPEYLGDKVYKSIILDPSSKKVTLDGDNMYPLPGYSAYYGTDSTGGKGYHKLLNSTGQYRTSNITLTNSYINVFSFTLLSSSFTGCKLSFLYVGKASQGLDFPVICRSDEVLFLNQSSEIGGIVDVWSRNIMSEADINYLVSGGTLTVQIKKNIVTLSDCFLRVFVNIQGDVSVVNYYPDVEYLHL